MDSAIEPRARVLSAGSDIHRREPPAVIRCVVGDEPVDPAGCLRSRPQHCHGDVDLGCAHRDSFPLLGPRTAAWSGARGERPAYRTMTPVIDVLDRGIRAALEDAPGQIGVVVSRESGVVLDIDGHDVVPAASMIKLPLLVVALRHVQAGDLALDQRVTLPSRRAGGSGAVALMPSLTALPLGELLHLMIAVSDNDAANAVADLVGMPSIAEFARSIGCAATRMRRPFMDFRAVREGRDNFTSVADVARMLTLLRGGALLDDRHTRLALRMLHDQRDRAGLPAYLGVDVRVGGKTGLLPGIRHDAAILERDGSWIVVAVAATDLLQEGVDWGTSVLPVFATVGAMTALTCLDFRE